MTERAAITYVLRMQRHLALILRMRLLSLAGGLREEWQDNRLKLFAGLFTMILMVVGMYALFHWLFSYLASFDEMFEGFGTALGSRLMNLAVLSLGVFVGVSSLITTTESLYRSPRVGFLLAGCARPAAVAAASVLEGWFHAAWTMLIMGVPLLWAYFDGFDIPLEGRLFGIALFPFLLLFWTAAGSLVSVALGGTGGATGWKLVLGTALIACAGFLVFRMSSDTADIVIADTEKLSDLAAFINRLSGKPKGLWPHVLFLGSFTSGRLINGLLLLFQGLGMAALALLAASRGFARVWSMAGVFRPGSGKAWRVFTGGGRLSTIFQKDLLLFARDPVQWSQLALLGGLFLIYTANLSRFSFDFSDPYWLAVGVFMNVSFCGFAVATMMVRFAFPSLSLEWQGFPVTISLPGGRRMLFMAKLVQTLILSLVPVCVVAWLSTRGLGAGPLLQLEAVLSVLLSTIALASINICLGAVFLRSGADSAVSIASGQGGIIAAFSSMGFILLMISQHSVVTRRYMTDGFTEAMLGVPMLRSIAFLLLPAAVIVSLACVRSGLRSLDRRVF